MPEFFYRFRSTAALLNGFEELERQEIYFSPPDQLNDPMEGFKNVVWRGDEILWRNLLRHYLLCLLNAYSLTMVAGSEFTPDLCRGLVRKTDEDLPDTPIRNILASARHAFFTHAASGVFIEGFVRHALSVKRSGLTAYLLLLHPLALEVVSNALADHGLGRIFESIDCARYTDGIMSSLSEMIDTHAAAGSDAETALESMANISDQMDLIQDFNRDWPQDRANWLFVFRDFPKFYVAALEQLLFPDWYTACFVRDPSNAAMWSVYGDGHRGVCLQFRSKHVEGGGRTLDLLRAVSLSGGQDETCMTYGYTPHRFQEVRYASDYPEIGFFETLGTLSRFKLSGFWYSGKGGELSPVSERVLREDVNWKSGYWDSDRLVATTKLPQWAHEQEHRLLLRPQLESFEDVASRKLRYRFSDLAGLVFGIRTSHADKIAIMRIIEKKAMAEKRTEFSFFQASHSRSGGSFEVWPLRLIQIQSQDMR